MTAIPSPAASPLVLRQRGKEHADGKQRRAQQEKGEDAAVAGGQVDLAKLGEENRVYRDHGQRDQIQRQQRAVLAEDDLRGGDGQRVEQLIGPLPPLLRQDAHGEDG